MTKTLSTDTNMSRRTAVKTIATGAAAAGLALSGGTAMAATSSTIAPLKVNQDAEILALSSKIQNALEIRSQANMAMGEYQLYTDGQGYYRDHLAERKQLDAQIKDDVAHLRNLSPTSTEAMHQRYIAFNNAYFTVSETFLTRV